MLGALHVDNQQPQSLKCDNKLTDIIITGGWPQSY